MKNSLFDLTGKRILITGSNGGIGFDIARGLANSGAGVILNGRNPEKLGQAVKKLRSENLRAEGSAFDVTDEAGIVAAVADLEAASPINCLVNNAGIQRRVRLDEVETATWNEVLATNLTSAMLVSREVAKRMIPRNAGKIVNICSLMSDIGRKTTGPYTAAKGGLKMLTKAMCADWAPFNIQVNAVGPGYFITEMTQVLANDEKFDAWVRDRTPARRWGLPAELVGATVFFCSDASSFVNGQIIYVDGGMISVL
jgi:gluconate 5-dehydrogenase